MRVDHDHESQIHDIIRLPCEACVDCDHESQIHDIIRLPCEACVDCDHESQIHDIRREHSQKKTGKNYEKIY